MRETPGTPLPPPKDPAGPYRICCVCLGNICRSPMAEVILRAQLAKAGLSEQVLVDSAGTGDWHVGERMDSRARAQLARNGYDGDHHRARQFDPAWLAHRDLILAMDTANLRDLRAAAPDGDPDRRIRLFAEVAGLGDTDVPDPYDGGPAEFARVLAMLKSGMATLVPRIPVKPRHQNPHHR